MNIIRNGQIGWLPQDDVIGREELLNGFSE
jgi:hypothetical protein